MSNHEERALDRALSAGQAAEGDLALLTEIGERIRNAYLTITPNHRAQRAMFVTAIGAQRRSAGWMRAFAPATVTALLLIGIMFLGRTALPGQAFYPVREVLRTVGLAPVSSEEVNSLLEQADRMLDEAESASMSDPGRGERLAFQATRIIGMIEGAIDELEIDERSRFNDELGDLLARAKAILATEAASDEDVDDGDKAFVRESDESDDEPGGDGGDNSNNGEGPNEGHDSVQVTNRDERDDDNDDDDGTGGNSGPDGDDDDGDGDDTNDDDTADGKSGLGDDDFDDDDFDDDVDEMEDES